MSLASLNFLLLFFPVIVLVYYLVFKTPRGKMLFLLAASMVFYSLAGLKFLPVLFGLSLFTYWTGRRGWIMAGNLVNLGALVLFKYWNFGVDNIPLLMKAMHISFAGKFLSIGLPLGISFFVFKHIGYLLDVKAKRYPASDDPWKFMTFSSYFPQIGAGPISSYGDTAGQFSGLPDRLDPEQASGGLVYLSFGLVKKVLIADQIGPLLASTTNTIGGFSGLLPSWYMVMAYAMQLYFDFSGYTDMALGASAFFGIKLPINFNSPYLSKNPAEFWGRWHFSLSTWFRYYLFSPISRWLLRKWGSSHGEAAQYTANLATMSLIGLWHGTGWGYILWGIYHGFLLNIHAWWKRTGREIPDWVSRPVFLVGLLAGWSLFMSPTKEYLYHLMTGLSGWQGLGDPVLINSLWRNNATLALLAAIPLAFSGGSEASNLLEKGFGRSKIQMAIWAALMVISIILLQGHINFFYVQF